MAASRGRSAGVSLSIAAATAASGLARGARGGGVQLTARRHLEPWKWGQGFKMLLETPLKEAIKKAVEEGTPTREAEVSILEKEAAEVGVAVQSVARRGTVRLVQPTGPRGASPVVGRKSQFTR
jgi:hypothetical protein